jgi:N-sulfoglucosamine sulfohydrolase
MKVHAVFVVSLVCIVLFLNAASGAEKPNILLMLSDDHSYPFVSCYGDSNVRTPTLDRLASEGMRFHRFFTACPQCVPSRAAYMTGRSPVAARMTRFSSPLPKDEITLPELLRSEANYFTGICGRSFHLDGSNPKGNKEQIDLLTIHDLRTFKSRVDFLEGSPDASVPDKVSAFLDKKPSDRPFFLWANFSDPHHPWDAPKSFRPDPATLKLPAHWPDLPGVREQLADYCAEVNRIDQSIGKVLKVLEERGMLNNTILVFAGDNGAALPHGKGSLYDPGSNVPLIVRWPDIANKNSESRTLLSNEDIAPTLLEAAGVAPGPKMTGKSFLPLLVGKPYVARKHVFVERGPHGSAPVTVGISSSGFDLSRAVRSDKFKFIYNCTPWIPYSPVDSAGGQAWKQMKEANEAGSLASNISATYFQSPRQVYELYDLDQDPSELVNVVGESQYADVERELRVALAEKMVLDFDYLPLPETSVDSSRDSIQLNRARNPKGTKQNSP